VKDGCGKQPGYIPGCFGCFRKGRVINMGQEKTEEREETLDALMAQAELQAEADNIASGDRSGAAERLAGQEDEDAAAEAQENPYEVVFDREYSFDNGGGVKKYRKLDMSGLPELTTTDGEVFDRVLVKLRHNPANKFNDTTYTKHVAMKVTGLPAEFFNQLNIRDMQKVTAAVYYYFLVG